MRQLTEFFQKNIAVFGLGIEGQSVIEFLLKQQSDITVFDHLQKGITPAVLGYLKEKNIKYVPGEFSDVSGFDMVIVSPGIRPDIPVLKTAREKGVKVTSATNIFMDLCPCQTIGVTGTKGKGTTSSLICEMLKAAKYDAYLGGNIGTPPLDFLDKLTPESVVVLELSSFQIFSMLKGPDVAVILMVTSEHLDYHTDTNEYVMAKANLLRRQNHEGQVVVNIDYPNSRKIGELSGKNYWQVSTKNIVKHGVCVVGDTIQYVNGNKHQDVVITKDIFIPGAHNWENVAAAVAVGKMLNLPVPVMRRVITSFRGLPHRIEFIREVNGVKYYDDSFSTTPETAVAATNAFSAPKVMILGGSSKNSDFSELGKVIRSSGSIRAIVGIGAEWPRIKSRIVNTGGKRKVKLRFPLIEGCQNMSEAVKAAADAAKPGDVVVLSPACASFDMFKNYKDRGDQFKLCVKGLN